MLEKVQQLSDSITGEQYRRVQSALGENLFDLLEHAFDSEDEDQAKERVRAFISEAKNHKFRVLKMRRIFTSDQQSLLVDLWEDNAGN